MPGKLIVIEGLDGSGKSTQTELLQKKLAALSVDTKRIKLPDYDDPSSTLVRMYLGGEFGNDPSCVNVYAASSFYAVDRYASYSRHWKEDYLSGKVILADRYTSSNAVHQAVKLPQSEWDAILNGFAITNTKSSPCRSPTGLYILICRLTCHSDL